MTENPLLTDTLALLRTLTAWPSVDGNLSAQGQTASYLEQWMVTHLHAEVVYPVANQLAESPPLVHVRIDTGAKRNLVIYNMYDVMPAEPEGWQIAPFVGGVSHWAEYGDVFIGRGAENNKGPVAAMLILLRQMLSHGELTTNIEIVLEGEEEIGSSALRRYLARQPCPVSPAKAVLFPSFCEYGGGTPRVYLGFTGLASGKLTVKGGAWGGPSAAIHASNAAWIANPAWRLVELLNELVPGAKSGVIAERPLDSQASELLVALASQFSLEQELRFRRSERFMLEGDTQRCLKRLLGSAVLNLTEIHSSPPGARGIIPYAATAELAFRSPPLFDSEAVIAIVEQRLASQPKHGAVLQLTDSYPGVRFAREACGVRQLIDSYRAFDVEPQIWPWAPGCAPAYAFAPIADAFLIGGLGTGGNAHGTNEFVTLHSLGRFQAGLRLWLTAFKG